MILWMISARYLTFSTTITTQPGVLEIYSMIIDELVTIGALMTMNEHN
jgi:hypothetical protein